MCLKVGWDIGSYAEHKHGQDHEAEGCNQPNPIVELIHRLSPWTATQILAQLPGCELLRLSH